MSVPTTRLKRVVLLRAGGTPAVSNPAFWAQPGEGTPWVSIGDMSDGAVVTTTERELTADGLRDRRLEVGPPGTLLFAMYASVGAVAELGVEAAWNQALLGLRPERGRADPRFVRYWLEHLRPSLAGLVRSNTQDNLNAEQVGNFPFPVAAVEQQRAIADFLDTETARIDALITKKRRMIDLLEERVEGTVSAALWSGEFTPTRLKFLCGLPTSGNRDHSSFTPDDEGVPCLRGLNVRPGRLETQDLLRISSDDHARLAQTRLQPGDLVIVRSGNAGSAAVIPDSFGDVNCVDLVVVRRSARLDPSFLEYVVNSREAQEQVKSKSAGALLTHFNAVDAGDLVVPLVALEDQTAIVARLDREVGQLRSIASRLAQQVDLLQEHRQALITAAVTGELEVPGVAA